MITLINGFPQGPNGLIVPNGSIKFQLNVDATVIAAPGGFVAADIPVVFQFDKTGALIQPAKIWSNEELQPQLSSTLLGTFYLVTFYDQNGAVLNATPLWWQFPEVINSTVDISQMTPVSTVGGNVLYYPTSFGGSGTVTSVTFTGDGTVLSATPSAPVTTSGTIAATLLTQNALTFLAGPTTPGPAAAPTFRTIVSADIPVPLTLSIGTATNALTLTNSTAATSGANQNSPIFSIKSNFWNGSASVVSTTSLQDFVASGSGGNVTTELSNSGATTWQGLLVNGNLTSSNNITTTNAFLSQAINGAEGLVIRGTTAASGAGNISSGVVKLGSAWWDGGASHASTMIIEEVVGTGSNPTETLTFSNSGAFAWAGVSIHGGLGLTGLISTYNNIATAGNGVPSEPFQIASSALTANYSAGSAKTIFTPTAATILRVTVQQAIVVADGTSSTLPSLTLGYTDVGGIARTLQMIATDTGDATTVYHTATALIYTNTSTVVTVTSASYASNTPAKMTYSLLTTVEIL